MADDANDRLIASVYKAVTADRTETLVYRMEQPGGHPDSLAPVYRGMVREEIARRHQVQSERDSLRYKEPGPGGRVADTLTMAADYRKAFAIDSDPDHKRMARQKVEEARTVRISTTDEVRISIREGDHGFSFAVKDALTDERIGSGGPYANKEFAVQEAGRVRDAEIERRAPAPPSPLYNPQTDLNYIQERAYHAKYYPATPQVDHGPELDFGPPSVGWTR